MECVKEIGKAGRGGDKEEKGNACVREVGFRVGEEGVGRGRSWSQRYS